MTATNNGQSANCTLQPVRQNRGRLSLTAKLEFMLTHRVRFIAQDVVCIRSFVNTSSNLCDECQEF